MKLGGSSLAKVQSFRGRQRKILIPDGGTGKFEMWEILHQENYIVFLDGLSMQSKDNFFLRATEKDTWELSGGGGRSRSWRGARRPARAERWRPGGCSAAEMGGGGWGQEGV